jgi:hypothetical protein
MQARQPYLGCGNAALMQAIARITVSNAVIPAIADQHAKTPRLQSIKNYVSLRVGQQAASAK